MNNKKYFWLKLKDDFFRDKRIKKLRRIAGGDTYTVIYLKLQLLSLKNNGVLIFEGVENTLAEELALDIDEEEDNVKVTLAFLEANGLIEETEQDHFIMTETIKCIGSESSSAERVRKHRELKAQKQQALQCNTPVTNGNIEIEKEREQEKEEELEQEQKEEKEAKPLTPNGAVCEGEVLTFEEQAFKEFWTAYPKKIDKKGCYKKYIKIKNLKEVHPLIMASLENFKKSKDWLNANGQYIPYPATFINQERWNDKQDETRADVLNNIDMGGWV